jgi:hypothetical protein
MALKSNSIVLETTDTFSQLISDLNTNRLRRDSDFAYLDSAIGPGGTLTLDGLSDFTANTLVDALNELDSDLHGSGGGSGSDLDTQAKTVVGAINEIEAVFDANAGKITTDSAFDVTSAGAETHTVAGNFEVDASGDITLDAAGQNITFKQGALTRLDFALGATNTLSVTNNLVIDAVGDITLDADGNGIKFLNGAGGDEVNHQLTDAAAYNVTYPGNVTHSVTGDLIYEVTGRDLIIKDSADEKLRINITDTPNITFAGTQSSIINTSGTFALNIAGDIIFDADGGDILLRDDGVQFGSFKNTSGNLILKSGTTTAMTFSGGSVTVAGSITLPSTGTGSITSSEISATTVHGAIDEVNERIPNVYNRSGTLLNP